MVGIANVTTHGQAKQLAHEMVFQSGADDLALVVEIFRADKTHYAIDQKWLKDPGHTVSARFKRELIDTVMSVSRERAALTGYEVHAISNWQLAISFWLLAFGCWPLVNLPISFISGDQR